jgi:hypothetical protein
MQTIYIEKKVQQQTICEKLLTSVNTLHPELKLNYSYEQSTDLSVVFEIEISVEYPLLTQELVKKLYAIN